MAHLLALTKPQVKTVRIKDVVYEAPCRLEKSAFYREAVATSLLYLIPRYSL